jgi:hypothetical protein
LSTSVVLPWSTCAMMAMFLIGTTSIRFTPPAAAGRST